MRTPIEQIQSTLLRRFGAYLGSLIYFFVPSYPLVLAVAFVFGMYPKRHSLEWVAWSILEGVLVATVIVSYKYRKVVGKSGLRKLRVGHKVVCRFGIGPYHFDGVVVVTETFRGHEYCSARILEIVSQGCQSERCVGNYFPMLTGINLFYI